MLLWLALAVLMVSAAGVVIWPLWSAGRQVAAGGERGDGSLAVYKDQLAEIEADLRNGVIAPSDAEAARIELSRRMLDQASQGVASLAAAPAPSVSGRWLAVATAAAIPLVSLPLYLINGAPSQSSQSARERFVAPPVPLTSEQAAVAELVVKVEARLRARPDDGMGWDVIAPVYMKQERFDDARIAFRKAIQLLGESPKRLTGLAEGAIRASGGRIPDEAKVAFEKLLKIEPQRLEPRFWLALRREQDGDFDGAVSDYRALLAAAPADAAWQPAVEDRLARAEARLARTGVAGGLGKSEPGPSAEAVAAAQSMSPADRERMIQGMVEGLHGRLRQEGRDSVGWQRLLRAYVVMGQKDKASAALAEARQALRGDAAALGEIDGAARELGLGS